MSAEGAVLFARYAYPPNELGYCGPDGAWEMLDPAAVSEIGRRARLFEGAWSYLELLAEAKGTDDPLDAEVVEAYWVGGDLLGLLDPGALVERLERCFAGQPGGTWREARQRAAAHHSFQVFEVYPWARLLLEGRPPGPAVEVLDRCRIRVGVVRDVAGESLTAMTRTLVWDGDDLAEGDAVLERARWSVDGRALMAPPAAGNLVALHWDWVCDVVSPEQALRMAALERARRVAVGLTIAGEA